VSEVILERLFELGLVELLAKRTLLAGVEKLLRPWQAADMRGQNAICHVCSSRFYPTILYAHCVGRAKRRARFSKSIEWGSQSARRARRGCDWRSGPLATLGAAGNCPRPVGRASELLRRRRRASDQAGTARAPCTPLASARTRSATAPAVSAVA